jgi:hypothetical protein
MVMNLLLALLVFVIVLSGCSTTSSTDNKLCETNGDCKIMYGCECGCYNEGYELPIESRECKCMAPSACECVNNTCQSS